MNDASGVPILFDQLETITGEVTVSNQFSAAANMQTKKIIFFTLRSKNSACRLEKQTGNPSNRQRTFCSLITRIENNKLKFIC
jgi:hypothetical protein